MSDDRLRRLEKEVTLLRKLVHASSASRTAEQLVLEAEARCERRLRRVRKKLLLASHPDKLVGKSKDELAARFNQVVREILKL
jgi:hypothetical protein